MARKEIVWDNKKAFAWDDKKRNSFKMTKEKIIQDDKENFTVSNQTKCWSACLSPLLDPLNVFT